MRSHILFSPIYFSYGGGVLKRILVLVVAFCFVMASVLAEEPSVSAKSAVVYEYGTGKVIFSKNADTRMPMASTTKIMTALVALEEGNLGDVVTIGPNAEGVEGSSMYLKSGETLSLSDLLYGLMLTSGNDAAVAIAEHIAGSEEAFAEKMTERAKALGCVNTQFKNANGLPNEEHYTTATELAKITGKALENDMFRQIVSSKSAKIGGRTLTNHNKFLSMYDGAIGVKTGFTKASGRTLVTAAERGGIRLIAVTLHAPDDWDDHAAMLDYAFDKMERRELTKKGEQAGEVAVEKGTDTTVSVCFASDFDIPVVKTEKTEVVKKLPEVVPAPILEGDKMGVAEIFLEGVKMGEVPLLAAATVEEEPEPTIFEYVLYAFSKWAKLHA